ncbi:MAG: GNAT family N-acetyltransferase [Kiloniellales bacterium]
MSAGFALRLARIADAPAIARVHVETWRSAYAGLVPDTYLVGMTESERAQAWLQRLIKPDKTAATVVAEVAPRGVSQVVGFGDCGPARSPQVGCDGEVYALYVAPDWQGRGIGRALLERCFRELAKAGFDSAAVWVLSENPSRFFYEAMGGRRIAEDSRVFASKPLSETAYAWVGLGDWRAAGKAPRSSSNG